MLYREMGEVQGSGRGKREKNYVLPCIFGARGLEFFLSYSHYRLDVQ